MLLTTQELIGLPVVTRSGTTLGKIHDIAIDVETRRVAQYFVRRKGMLPRLTDHDFIIADRQVVTLTETQLVVEDAVEKEETVSSFGKRFTPLEAEYPTALPRG